MVQFWFLEIIRELNDAFFFQTKSIVQINSSTGHCDLANTFDEKVKSFVFDGAYSSESTTEQIYNEIVFPLVEVGLGVEPRCWT